MYIRFYLMSDEMCYVLVFGTGDIKLFKTEIVILYKKEIPLYYLLYYIMENGVPLVLI